MNQYWQTASDDDITYIKTSPGCNPGTKHIPGDYTYWYKKFLSGKCAVMRFNKLSGKHEIAWNVYNRTKHPMDR